MVALISLKQSRLLILLALALSVPLIIFAVGQFTNLRQRAASHAAELENGVFGGTVTVINDAAASGGKYIQLGQ